MYMFHLNCTDLLKFTDFTEKLTTLYNISCQYNVQTKDYLVQIQEPRYLLQIQAQIKEVICLWEKIPEAIRNQDGFAGGIYDMTRVETKKIKHRLDILKEIVDKLDNLENSGVWEVADGMRLMILHNSNQSHIIDLLMQLRILECGTAT